MSSSVNFILCEYFNAFGEQVERIIISGEDVQEASAEAVLSRSGQEVHDAIECMRAEAKATGQATTLEDASLALTALLSEVTSENISIDDAREVFSISVNLRERVTIPDIMPTLEMRYGANAANWARGIFPHLRLGHPGIQ